MSLSYPLRYALQEAFENLNDAIMYRLPESQRQSIDVMNMAEIQQAAGALMSTLSYLLGTIEALRYE